MTDITVTRPLENILEHDSISAFGDGGRLVECGAPSDLLKNKDGFLSQMADQDENLSKCEGKGIDSTSNMCLLFDYGD